jgi:hypothetical protein
LIELQMVRRMSRRAAVLAGPVVLALGLWGGVSFALSGAAGLGMALLNLWLAGRIIGGVADSNPQLLLAAGMATFFLGLIVLTVLAWALQTFDIVSFPVTGITLVTAHLGLVLWEASGKQTDSSTAAGRSGLRAAKTRS